MLGVLLDFLSQPTDVDVHALRLTDELSAPHSGD